MNILAGYCNYPARDTATGSGFCVGREQMANVEIVGDVRLSFEGKRRGLSTCPYVLECCRDASADSKELRRKYS